MSVSCGGNKGGSDRGRYFEPGLGFVFVCSTIGIYYNI
jgi:hypothetical protein